MLHYTLGLPNIYAALRKDYDRKGLVEKKSLVVSLKGHGSKTN
jgi:hypothetical protein